MSLAQDAFEPFTTIILLQLLLNDFYRADLIWQLVFRQVLDLEVHLLIGEHVAVRGALQVDFVHEFLIEVLDGLCQVHSQGAHFLVLLDSNSNVEGIRLGETLLMVQSRLDFVGFGPGAEFHAKNPLDFTQFLQLENEMTDLGLTESKPFVLKGLICRKDRDLDKVVVGPEKVELFKESLPREVRVDFLVLFVSFDQSFCNLKGLGEFCQHGLLSRKRYIIS